MGSGSDNKLEGLGGNDMLDGGAGNDSLLGGAGGDVLIGGAGNDTIDGGVVTDRVAYSSDNNTVTYASSNAGVNVDLSGISGDGSTGSGTAADGLGGIDTLMNLNYVIGSGYDDIIKGSSALVFETFQGGAGNDTIDGGAVTDTLNGDNTNGVEYSSADAAVDVNLTTGKATGGAGNDSLANLTQVRGSAYGDALTGSGNTEQTEQFEGRGGNDTIDGAGGLDLVRFFSATAGVKVNLTTGVAMSMVGDSAGVGTDTLYNIEGIRGSSYADSLTGGNAANDALEFFQGRAGNDTIDGGSGYDRTEYTLSSAGVNVTLGGAGIGTATGDASVDTDTLISIEGVRGSAFDDTLTGSSDGTVFETFEGREGNDTINGLAGTDQVRYDVSRSGITVNLVTGTASDGYGSTDSLSNIEDVLGSRKFNDHITGNTGDNKLEGQGGNDTLTGGAGNDSLLGGDGTDSASFTGLWRQYALSGNPGTSASLNGPDGNDSLSSIEKLQFIDGTLNSGVWAINGNAASAARLYWGTLGRRPDAGGAIYWTGLLDSGQKTLAQEAAAFVGSSEFQSRYGSLDNGQFVNKLYQNVPGRAADAGGLAYWTGQLGGGMSRPNLALAFTESPEFKVRMHSLIDYGIVTDHAVLGTEYANNLPGTAQADFLVGGGGNDTLSGSGGNDTLVGGAGNDSLTGGSGQDSFRFDSLLNASNRDTISDYHVDDDTIELDHAVFAALRPGILAAGSFRSGPSITSAADADDYLIYDSSSGALYYDANGSGGGAAVQFATLTAGPALTSVDFLVV